MIPLTNNTNIVATNTISNLPDINKASIRNSYKDFKFKPFTLKLKLRSTGAEVLQLQNFLISRGFMVNSVPTSYFGNVTVSALKAYQKSKGIESTGAVGPATLKALNSDIDTKSTNTNINVVKTININTNIKTSTNVNTQNLKLDFGSIKKLDDEDESIKLIQKILQKKNYLYTKATGYFGVSTERAIKEFQKDNGLKVTGVYDKETAEALSK